MKKYKCKGEEGCEATGCEIVVIGRPKDAKERIYMCPYNHWRSCAWEEVKTDTPNV